MRMVNSTIFLITWIANIIFWANLTAPTLASFYIQMAHVACCDKSWSCGIVKMIKDHHRRMFSTAKGIILVMVSLTKTQKCLSGVKELALKNFISIFSINRYIIYFNLKMLSIWFVKNMSMMEGNNSTGTLAS